MVVPSKYFPIYLHQLTGRVGLFANDLLGKKIFQALKPTTFYSRVQVACCGLICFISHLTQKAHSFFSDGKAELTFFWDNPE